MSASRRISRALIRLYPRAWRARYEDEMLALLEDSGASMGALVDLATALTKEWIAATIGRRASEATRLSAAGLRDMVLLSAIGMALMLLSLAVGAWMRRLGVQVPPASVMPAFAVFILAPVRAIAGLAVLPGRSLSFQFPRWPIGRLELSLWLTAVFGSALWIVLGDAMTGPLWTIAMHGTCVQAFGMMTRTQIGRQQRLQELRGEAARRALAPRNPLGLGPSA
jgi:hypothetical protein